MGVESEVYGLNGSLAQDQPFYLNMLQSVPGVLTTTGWNIGRVERTMTSRRMKTFLPRFSSGTTLGRRQITGLARREMSGLGHSQGISQTLNPRNFRRLSRAANIDPSFYGESRLYSPFNVLASTGNFLFKKRGATNVPGIGSKANTNLARASGKLSGKFGISEGEVPFSPGTFGRIAGMDKITRMSKSRFAGSADNMLGAIRDINPAARGLTIGGRTVQAQQWAMASEFGSTITGSISGRAAGYIHGASAMRAGTDAFQAGLSGSRGFFLKGYTEGAEAFRAGSKLAKFAPYAGPALRAVSAASNILLVHDLALMAGKGVGAVVRTGIEAVQSAKGSIDKSIMGMGFKDNSVAATSRQRGVMAIQNSQLNARSILGSEAGMLASHFG